MNLLERMSPEDHRKAPRLRPSQLVAHYWNGGAPVPHEIQNISSTGFYLLTEDRWLPGTMIRMTFQRTSTEQLDGERHIAVLTKVVRTDKDGVGFVFMLAEHEDKGQTHLAGEKTIGKLLEHVKSDRGHAALECLEEALKRRWARQDSRWIISGDPWRERYEESKG